MFRTRAFLAEIASEIDEQKLDKESVEAVRAAQNPRHETWYLDG
jgi:hypothetical protein